VDDFPSNSQRRQSPRKEEPKTETPAKKLDRVVEGKIVRRKKPLGKRLREAFLGGDNRSVLEFVIQDVIVPNIRDMVFEAGQQGLERSLYGDSVPFRRGIGSRPGDPRRMTNYNGIARGPARDRVEERQLSRRARANHDFGEIIIPTRPEAEAVLEGLFAVLDEYEVTDRKWGWTDLRGTDVLRVREGWLLDLPRPEVID
jgi:hypothetical protein